MFFKNYESQLGPEAKLGVSFYLLDDSGQVISQENLNTHIYLPMASTKKVAIALAVYHKIYHDDAITLNSIIKIEDADFSPGPPTNSLDRYFYFPFNMSLEKTVDELLTLMLTESDNTATDKLLNLIGGTAAVNDLMHTLGITGYFLARPSKQLLADYYEISKEKSILNILKTIYTFFYAYQIHRNEKTMFTQNEDCCTPEAMSRLLKLLLIESKKEDNSWLSTAAKQICNKMQNCKTGANLIKKATLPYASYINQFGHKTGGLGGIRNDAAFIKLTDGKQIVLSIYSCLSPLPLATREEIISNIALSILQRHIPDVRNASPEPLIIS